MLHIVLMFSVPNPKLGDAGDTVVTNSSGGRQSWHQTTVKGKQAEGTGLGWEGLGGQWRLPPGGIGGQLGKAPGTEEDS